MGEFARDNYAYSEGEDEEEEKEEDPLPAEAERQFLSPEIRGRSFLETLGRCFHHERAQLILTDPPFGVLKSEKRDILSDEDIRVRLHYHLICVILC